MRGVACHDRAGKGGPEGRYRQNRRPSVSARSLAGRAVPNPLPAANPRYPDDIGALRPTQPGPPATDHAGATSPPRPVASAITCFATLAAMGRPLRCAPCSSRVSAGEAFRSVSSSCSSSGFFGSQISATAPICKTWLRPGAKTGVVLASCFSVSRGSLVTRDIDGKSMTVGSAPGRPTKRSVASAVARNAPAAALPYSNPTVRCPCWLASSRHLARCARYSLRPRISSRLAMSWPCVSTSTRIGVSPPCATTRSTSSARGSPPAVPRGAPFATPITATAAPFLRLPAPVMTPSGLVFTSWPDGNRPLRISSSVMVGFLDAVGECGKLLAVHIPDRLRLLDAQNPPHGHCVIARAEPLLTGRQPFLLCLHCIEIEGRNLCHEGLGGGAEPVHGTRGKGARPADQPAVLAAIGAPYERLVLSIELLDPLVGLDRFRAGDSDPALFRHCDAGTGRRGQPGASECAGLAADQSDHGHTSAAGLDDRPHQLGDCQLACVRLLQTYPTAIHQQQNGPGQVLVIARRPQEANQFGPADFGEGAAHELAFLRRDEHRLSVQRAAANDDPVVECRRQVEQRKVRTLHTLGGSQKLGEAIRVQQARHALARGRLKPAGLASCRRVFHHSVSISALPCIRRRKTVSGRAPPPLIEMRKPPGEERSTNSATTAFQVSP